MCVTYGPSDQVKTCPKPHDRTSFSAEARDLVMLSFFSRWESSGFGDGSIRDFILDLMCMCGTICFGRSLTVCSTFDVHDGKEDVT